MEEFESSAIRLGLSMHLQNSPAAESTTVSSLSSMQDAWEQEQYPCPTGQAYTSQRQLVPKTTFELVPEESDARILRIKLTPSLAIGQTPIVLLTPAGAVIWDCCGFASAELMQRICSVSPTGQVFSIVISHPHFFGASLSWAKMLNCNVFISKLDRQWYQRGLNCQDTHPDIAARRKFVVEVQEDLFRLPHLPSVALIRCGGHFPGSGVLHWDRDSEDPDGHVRKGAAVFCADTFMCLLDGQRFTFAYSFPNNIPLPPRDVEQIWVQMRKLNWTATFGGWSGRQVLTDSRAALLRSARYYIEKEGHSPDAFEALSECTS
ncbi:Metallo-beta-lactamase domain-containing protein [Pseudozyma hubeiensis]|nr:Metallo-beta-lactamase domain-containing protein [Pseudozyma hubeiensis]